MDIFRLDGKVALVTGAGSPSGIGYATAARLLTSFGKTRQAEAVRAEAQRTFAASRH